MAIVSSIKQGAARYAASALIAAGLIAGGAAAVAANPADAFALSPSTVAGQMSDGSGNTASTAVWLQADTDKLIVACLRHPRFQDPDHCQEQLRA